MRLAKAPLRICPLGAHVDHQLGCVTGLTLDRAVLLAFAPRRDDLVRLASLDFPGQVEFHLADIPPAVKGDWGSYPRGAAWVMGQTHPITKGFDGLISGPLPIGGLSSSAAVDVAYLLALQTANEVSVAPRDNVRLAQRIENDFVGLNNGILDQSMILCGQAGALTWLDCRDFEVTQLPTPDPAAFEWLVVYSGLSRSLVSSDYNLRVSECETAARLLLSAAAQPLPERPKLRQVEPAVFAEHGDTLPARPARRARHFYGEMDRVALGAAAWRAGELAEFGRLMTASGESSIVNYECGSPHLVSLHELLNSTPGVYGARFSGAGFRGACIALVAPGCREAVVDRLAAHYPQRHPDVAAAWQAHFCAPSGPAEVL